MPFLHKPIALQFGCEKYTNTAFFFPYFSAALPQDVKGNPVLVSCRETELAKRNKTYPWMSCQLICLPSAFDDKFKLPTNEGFQFVKNVNFYSSGGIDAVDAAVGGITSEANTLSGYEKFAKLHPVPDVRVYELGRWTRDVEFGRQILNGVNPVVIRRCDTLPHNFPVTDDMVKGSLDRGMSLEEAMKVIPLYNSVVFTANQSKKHFARCN